MNEHKHTWVVAGFVCAECDATRATPPPEFESLRAALAEAERRAEEARKAEEAAVRVYERAAKIATAERDAARAALADERAKREEAERIGSVFQQAKLDALDALAAALARATEAERREKEALEARRLNGIQAVEWERRARAAEQDRSKLIAELSEADLRATGLEARATEAERRAEQATRERDAWHKDAVYRVNAENDRRAALRRAEDAEARVATLTDALREARDRICSDICTGKRCVSECVDASEALNALASPSGAAEAPRPVTDLPSKLVRAIGRLAEEAYRLVLAEADEGRDLPHLHRALLSVCSLVPAVARIAGIESPQPAPAATETGTREGLGTCAYCSKRLATHIAKWGAKNERPCCDVCGRKHRPLEPAPAAGDARGEATTISNEESDHG